MRRDYVFIIINVIVTKFAAITNAIATLFYFLIKCDEHFVNRRTILSQTFFVLFSERSIISSFRRSCSFSSAISLSFSSPSPFGFLLYFLLSIQRCAEYELQKSWTIYCKITIFSNCFSGRITFYCD